MKNVTLVSFCAMCALLIAGCGGDNGTADSGGGGQDLSASAQDLTTGGQPDLTSKPLTDMAYTPSTDGGPFTCGGAGNCAAQGKMCCVSAGGPACMTSCADGGFPVQCSGPEFCGGDPCCVTVTNGSPTSVACTTDPKACMPNFNFSTFSGMTRACHADVDCTAGGITTNYPDCCTVTGSNGQRICFNKAVAAGSMGRLTCP